jgi:hypothetical protein
MGRRFKDQFPPWGRNIPWCEWTESPARWVVNLKCYLLSLLKLHSPDCELCNAREKYGEEMRRRLEELNWRTQPSSPNNGVFDSKPGEVLGTPVSLAQQEKKVA